MRTYTVLYTSLACWWSCSDFSCIAEYSHRSDHHDTPWHQIVRFAMAMCTHYSLYCKLLSRLIKYYYLHYVNNLRTEFNIHEQKTLLRFKCSIFGYFWEIRPEKGSGQRRDQIHIIAESKGGFVIIYLWIFHTRARTTRTLFSKDKKQSNENASKASKQYLIIKFYMWDPGPACKRSDRTQVKKSYRIHINDPTGSYNYTKFR